MRKSTAAFLVIFLSSVSTPDARADPFPQLLPSADNFQLTLHEDLGNTLPLGPSCGGEAAQTLPCRAFLVTLKNVGTHTVHLSRLACQEPVVAFERKEPHSSSGWWPISQVSNPSCAPSKYENLRLRPGETTTYSTRLLSAKRERGPRPPTAPGSYAIRAGWQLVGCTEAHEGTDCLAPLQILKPNPWGTPLTGDIEYQSSVQVMSEAIEVSSPTLPDLGPLQLGFELSTLPESQVALVRKRLSAPCATNPATDPGTDPAISMDCTVFHYAIRNLGNRPVQNGRYTCSDYSIIPNTGQMKEPGSIWNPA